MNAVRMEEICKAFPGVLANDHVTFTVKKGEIHCLLGENGSGKSTLMNVLFGLYQKDGGRILINDKTVEIHSPADAERLGIGMVHQHFMLIPQLTVLENIILGNEPGKVVIDRHSARQQVQQIVDTYRFKLDLDSRVVDISVGMKQRVEILKLLYRGADIIIFDEPTAVLTPQEVQELFHIFRRLIEKNCTVIFITHKLNEIFEVSDRVTVLRKGSCVGSADTKIINAEMLSEMMVGRQIAEIKQLPEVKKGEVAMSIDQVPLLDENDEGISLQVHRGEIVGIAGIDGNGQMELEELITGVRKLRKGKIFICGKDAAKMSIHARKECGLAYIPSDRMRSGAMGVASIQENFLLGHQDNKKYKRIGFVQYQTLAKESETLSKEYEIKLVSTEQPFSGLSGGNQQKVILAREVSKEVSVVLAAQPIRGLDIGAIEYVHHTLIRLRSKGIGTLLISAELSELLSICDRIAVLCGGKITGEFVRKDFDENRIGLAMVGHTEVQS